MANSFLGLSGFAVLAYGASILWAQFAPEDPQSLQIHMLLGSFTAVFTLLVHTIALFYLMGTGRDIRDEVRRWKLPTAWAEEARERRRRTLPWGMAAMGWTLVTAVSGGGFERGVLASWFHPTLAYAGFLGNLWVFYREYGALRKQVRLIRRVNASIPQDPFVAS